MNRSEVITLIHHRFGAPQDAPFSTYPEHFVFRVPGGKWFALLLRIEDNKIGGTTTELVDVLITKNDPDRIAMLLTHPAHAPAYHINKTHWISTRIDMCEPVDIEELLVDSYDAVAHS
ncbi:MmcQ/YjbR family DNA-binding protein [Corynebacterium kutscheri]|uniref:MmcQ/YjbR family DNA-binding protein n=1 Tax=Corynebacterium kutscheri TaxID=35755 RepID=UPI0006233521|nr:MmcQ/YjbR family DNA-binding protein [Corynebacterium kutscheri]